MGFTTSEEAGDPNTHLIGISVDPFFITTKEVRKKYPAIKVLVVTMYEDDKFIIHLMENGANGYLLKNAESEEIRKSIYAVHENGYYFNDLVNKALLKKLVLKGNLKPSFNQDIEFTERWQRQSQRIPSTAAFGLRTQADFVVV